MREFLVSIAYCDIDSCVGDNNTNTVAYEQFIARRHVNINITTVYQDSQLTILFQFVTFRAVKLLMW